MPLPSLMHISYIRVVPSALGTVLPSYNGRHDPFDASCAFRVCRHIKGVGSTFLIMLEIPGFSHEPCIHDQAHQNISSISSFAIPSIGIPASFIEYWI